MHTNDFNLELDKKGKSLLQVAPLLPVPTEQARSLEQSEQLGPERPSGQPSGQGRKVQLLELRAIGAALYINQQTKGQSSPLPWAWAVETIKSTANTAKTALAIFPRLVSIEPKSIS